MRRESILRAINSHLCLLYSSFSVRAGLQRCCVAPSHMNDLCGFTWIEQVEDETYVRMAQWCSEKLSLGTIKTLLFGLAVIPTSFRKEETKRIGWQELCHFCQPWIRARNVCLVWNCSHTGEKPPFLWKLDQGISLNTLCKNKKIQIWRLIHNYLHPLSVPNPLFSLCTQAHIHSSEEDNSRSANAEIHIVLD